MRKYLIFLYALVGYALSMLSLSLLILWVYPWSFMSLNIDSSLFHIDANPVLVNLGLLLLFGLQHSVMARSFFKDGLLKNISSGIKYGTYSIASSICLVLIVLFWQEIDGYLWDFHDGIGFWIFTVIYFTGWIMAYIATFMIDHFELFGLHQGYRALKNLPEPEVEFQIKYFYKYVRHPIQAGTIVGLWATPSMSYSHLLLSVGMSLYVFIGLYFEERDMIKTFGKKYQDYIQTTPFMIPFIKKRANGLA